MQNREKRVEKWETPQSDTEHYKQDSLEKHLFLIKVFMNIFELKMVILS